MTETTKTRSRPITLAIELSQRDGGIAMCNSAGETVVRETASGKRDDDDVMPAIASAVKELGCTPHDVELVIVSIGPGGFTGLRTATSIAKMVSFATGASIITIESAIVVAASSDLGKGPFLVVSSVKQDEFWLSRVVCVNGTWECEAGISNSSKLGQHIQDICGVFADGFLPDSARDYFALHEVPINEPILTVETLLTLGLTLHDSGHAVDPIALLPLYPREPEAVRKWKTDLPRT